MKILSGLSVAVKGVVSGVGSTILNPFKKSREEEKREPASTVQVDTQDSKFVLRKVH